MKIPIFGIKQIEISYYTSVDVIDASALVFIIREIVA